MSRFYRGKFKPHNRAKYIGDSDKIIYRSSWELSVFRTMDCSDAILEWSSEELAIPYRSPADNKIHRYFPDLYLRTANGSSIIEIKPFAQTQPPKRRKRSSVKYIREVNTYLINQAKWKAARAFCKAQGWSFRLLTEKQVTAWGK